jgi:Protein of unknown function (DUF1588)/Protein of unknown function (DUF1592)/Protein of unknown function (DUF1585)
MTNSLNKMAWMFGFLFLFSCKGTLNVSPSSLKKGGNSSQSSFANKQNQQENGKSVTGASNSSEFGADRKLDTSQGFILRSRATWFNLISSALGEKNFKDTQFLEASQSSFQGHFAISALKTMGETEMRLRFELAKKMTASYFSNITNIETCPVTTVTLDCAKLFLNKLISKVTASENDKNKLNQRVQKLLAANASTVTLEDLQLATVAVMSSSYAMVKAERTQENTQNLDINLSDLALRISSLAGDTIPDEEIRKASASGELFKPEVRSSHFLRISQKTQNKNIVRQFVREWMSAPHSKIKSKSAELLKNIPSNASELAETAFEDSVDKITVEKNSQISSFLKDELSNTPTWAGQGKSFGIVMSPYVIAAHTKETGFSPFELGKFVNESLLCAPLGSPPPLPADASQIIEGLTFRESLEKKTSSGSCQFCHSRLSPPGFALFAFNSVGTRIDSDPMGRIFDTSGTLKMDGADFYFSNEKEFVERIAESARLRKCLARRVFRFGLERFETQETLDVQSIQTIETAALVPNASLMDLFSALVKSEAFQKVKLGEQK